MTPIGDDGAVQNGHQRTLYVSFLISLLWCAGLVFVLRRPLAEVRDSDTLHLLVLQLFQPGLLLAAIVAYAGSLLLRGWRWRLAVPDVQASLHLLTSISAIHAFWINVLPARSGELSFLHMARKYAGAPYAYSGGALYVVRLCDATVLAAYGTLSLCFLRPLQKSAQQEVWIGLFVGAAGLALAALWLSPRILRWQLAGPLPLGNRTRPFLRTVLQSLEYSHRRHRLLPILLLTVAAQGLVYLTYGFLMLGLGLLPLSLARALFALSLVEGASALPVHGLLSLGSQETVWVIGLGVQGIAPAHSVAAGLLLHASIVMLSTLFAAMGWLGLRSSKRHAPEDDVVRSPGPIRAAESSERESHAVQ